MEVAAPNIAAMPVTMSVLGARGSWPVSGTDVLEYGGRTTSYRIQMRDDLEIFIDAGTGISYLPEAPEGGRDFHIFLTHYHADHVQGLQFFKPLYQPDNRFTFYGVPVPGVSLEHALGGIWRSPWFPVPFEGTPSYKRYVPIGSDPIELGSLTFRTTRLTHPQGVTAYRIDSPNGSVMIATDHEAGDEAADARLVELARGVDYLFHDAQYTPAEYEKYYKGWGHSTWEDAVAAAEAADVGTLVLTSHDPSRHDAAIDEILTLARARFPSTVAAHEGMQIEL